MNDYPASLPRPEWNNYSGTINAGLIRSNVDAPLPNQIVSYNSPTMQMNLSFTGTNDDMLSWAIWADANAWEWFKMELVSPRLPDENSPSSTVSVRFISDLQNAKLGDNWQRYIVRVEMIPGEASTGTRPEPPPIPPFDQIQPGTVPAPSTFAINPGTTAAPAESIIGWEYSWPT